MRFLLIAVLALLVGCHGIELRTGIGHTWNDVSSHGGVTRTNDWEVFEHSYDVDQDDSLSAWVELAFQLTPTSVEFYNPPTRAAVIPIDPVTDPIPPITITAQPELKRDPAAAVAPVLIPNEDLTDKVDELTAKLEELEAACAEPREISWDGLLVGGGTTGGLGVTGLLLWILLQRRRQQQQEAKAE